MDFSKETILAIQAAAKAGEAILEIYTSNFSSEFKSDQSPITGADIRSNEIIERMLGPSGYPILSEESADSADRLKAQTIWIVDPLDGTSDFIDRTGEFSVHIALVTHGVPVLGVVYQPTEKEFFVAEKGKGAYRGKGASWTRLEVSKISNLSQARFTMSRHHLQPEEKEFLARLGIESFEQSGSCGLKIAKIASGVADAYFSFSNRIHQWDTAPGYCIITEAGGRITDTAGNELWYNTAHLNHEKGIVVTNGKLHHELVRMVTNFNQ